MLAQTVWFKRNDSAIYKGNRFVACLSGLSQYFELPDIKSLRFKVFKDPGRNRVKIKVERDLNYKKEFNIYELEHGIGLLAEEYISKKTAAKLSKFNQVYVECEYIN